MAKIRKVVKHTWTLKTGETRYAYRVHYENKETYKQDRIIRYTENQRLPLTIVEFVLCAAKVETYYPNKKDIDPALISAKKETYTN